MNQDCKNQLSGSKELLSCPFCSKQCIEPGHGKTKCPMCDAAFEFDDRAECVFGDTTEIKLPVFGLICATCGLIQAGENQNCLYCGAGINTTLQ
jgi:hypothetical protein